MKEKMMKLKGYKLNRYNFMLIICLVAITTFTASCTNPSSNPKTTSSSQPSSETSSIQYPTSDTTNTSGTDEEAKPTSEVVESDRRYSLVGTVDTKFYQTVSPESQGMSSELLYDMYQEITARGLDFHHIMILRNGKIVTEAHYYPYGADDLHIVNSITKDFTSALIGIAIDDGLIGGVDDPVVNYFENQVIDNMSDNKRKLTIENLLTMTAGMDWTETGNYSGDKDTYTQMWKSDNQIQFILDRDIVKLPGTSFYYNTGASHLLSGILTNATGKSAFDYGTEKLFEPLGIHKLFWSADNQGVSSGGSRLFIAPIDLAKFGMLYLEHGKFQGKQLLQEDWIKISTSKIINTPHGIAGRWGYGYQWWMNSFGGYSGRGYAGQYLFVLPEKNIVAVFMGSMGNNFYAPEQLMRDYVLKSVLSDNQIPANDTSDIALRAIEKELSIEPAAYPIPLMPKIASIVDAKIFTLENGESFTLDFDLVTSDSSNISNSSNTQKSNTAFATLTWHVENSNYVVKVGLDGIYRFTNCLNFYADGKVSEVGFMGSWVNDNTFQIKICPTDADSTYTLTLEYNGDKLSKTLITDMLGY
ncbi:serine hydrolase domain-containing protein [Fusibacter bizertensis]